MRRFINSVGGCAIAALFCGEAIAQSSSPIGTWTSALNPGTIAVIYLTLTIAPNGQLQERWMNSQGVFYDLLGSYQFDTATATFSYVFTDYSPKQLCSPIGCQPAPGSTQHAVEISRYVSKSEPDDRA